MRQRWRLMLILAVIGSIAALFMFGWLLYWALVGLALWHALK